MTARFTAKSVIIFGGNSGIGLAAALAFAEEGAKVAITGRNRESLDAAAAEHGLTAFRADIADPAASREVASAAADALGGFDVVFINAGVGGFMPAAELTTDFWDEVHSINLRGCFFAAQQCLPYLRDKGSIVFTGSIGSVLALAGNAAYAAAKAGLRAAARVLAHELLPRNIRVNLVSPGPTETEIFKRGASAAEIEGFRAQMRSAVPMGRIASAGEIAAAVLFLASDGAGYINGTELFVDGGCVEL